MQRRQVFGDSRQAAGAGAKSTDDGKRNGGYRLAPNFGEGDTTDNASSSVGRSKLKRFGDAETGATGGYSLADEESSNKRAGMVRHGATATGAGASSSAIPSASASKRSTSLPRHKQAPPTRLTTSKGSALPMASRMKRSGSGMSTAGAVDEDAFVSAFEDVPRLNLFSAKDLLTHIQQIRDNLGDPNKDWEKRVDSMKKLRALLLADAMQYDEFLSELRTLEIPFQIAVKDLRSQVAREACITIAFLSQYLGMKFDHFAEAILPPLINLIQNCAKVMATSGLVACTFIIKNTHAPKLIPIITSSMNSKSREIRRACADFVHQICHLWPTHALERNVTNLQEAIRQGLSDADPDARLAARKAYWGFRGHFKDQAEVLFLSLDAAKQRQLRGELSQSSSNNSIAAGPLRASQENLRGGLALQSYRNPGRSTSDIDTGAQRRARGGYVASLAAQAARTSRAPGMTAVAPHNMNSLPRPPRGTFRPTSGVGNAQAAPATPGLMLTPATPSSAINGNLTRTTRTPSKSISQPGSRSGSPTSRLPTSASGSVARKYRPPGTGFLSGLPVRSHGGSREHSPPRSGVRRYSTEENGQTPTSTGRFLTHETDLGALLSHRRITNPESMDLESETSSVCSERSFSTNVNRQIHLDNWELSEALKNCQSSQWSERKDGLSYMVAMFKSRRPYTAAELKKICDSFSRLFVDQHNKTFCMFLDTLVEFLAAYRNELHDWLYILLIRLLTKQSSDLLASAQTKLAKTLDVVRESFPYQVQFATLVRYIVDPACTPSLKMKVSVLNYLNNLACVMDSSHMKNSSDVRQAILRVAQWVGEPKSADVRRSSQNLLIALFGLNAGEFTSILSTFPKSQQDSVYRLLQSHLAKPAASSAASGLSSGAKPRTSMSPGPFGMGAQVDLDYVHDSLKRTSEEIQQYSFSGLQKVIGSQDSGIVDAVDSFQRIDSDRTARLLMEQLCFNFEEERQQEIITDVLTELSNHNTRNMERRKAMSTLKYMTRDGTFTLWDEHFKAILLILLETLGDNDPEIRSAALRTLTEICESQAPRFRDYAELTILRVVDAHKDEDKDVVRSAEELAGILASHLPPAVCLRILNPILRSDEPKGTLAAIKMITKALEKMSPTEAEAVLPDILPLIIKGFEHPTQSVIRKASVVCLVGFHHLIGLEKMEPYLSSLNNSKMKLLNLYIKRADTNSASPTSQI